MNVLIHDSDCLPRQALAAATPWFRASYVVGRLAFGEGDLAVAWEGAHQDTQATCLLVIDLVWLPRRGPNDPGGRGGMTVAA